MHGVAADFAETDVSVGHLAGRVAGAVGVDRLKLPVSDYDIQIIGLVPMQAGGFTGDQSQVPDPDTFILKEKPCADF
jgi:hypothetical protein